MQPVGELGAIAVKLPLPPWHFAHPVECASDRYIVKSYLTTFPGYYETGDAGMIDADGYLYIMARTDDVINVAGHRLSTGGIEEVLACPSGCGRMRGDWCRAMRSRDNCPLAFSASTMSCTRTARAGCLRGHQIGPREDWPRCRVQIGLCRGSLAQNPLG